MNKTEILLVVEDWISFYNQAEALAKGLQKIGIDYQIIRNSDVKKNNLLYKIINPKVVVGVGSWFSYNIFVKLPTKLGLKTIPWIVSDGKVYRYIKNFNKLNLILTPSNYCKNIFKRDGIVETKIKILPEATDPEFWSPAPEYQLNEFIKMLSISSSFPLQPKFDLFSIKKDDIPILLTIGGDATSKGAQEVIQALAKIDKKIPWIYLIKTWPQTHTFKRALEEFKLLKKYGLEDRVRYIVGEFSQEFIRNLLNLCDIYVAPSRGEGFGLPFVQAQMCEKPIISIDALSIKEIVENGKTGFLAKPSNGDNLRADIDDLKKHLAILITDKKLRQKMGIQARTSAVKKFNPKTIATKLIDYIHSI